MKSIRGRLMLLASLFAVMLAVSGIIGVSGIGITADDMEHTYNEELQSALLTNRLMQLMGDNRAQIMLALQHNPENPLSHLHDHPLSMHFDQIQKNRDETKKLSDELERHDLTAEEHRLFQTLLEIRATYREQGTNPALEALSAGRYTRANEILLKQINPLYKKTNEAGQALLQEITASARSNYENARQRYVSVRNWLTFGTLIVVVLAVFSGILISRNILGQLGGEPDKVAAVIRRVADGDLGLQVETKADDRHSVMFIIKGMVEQLSQTISKVNATAGNIASASEQVSVTAQGMSLAATEQAASVGETTVSVERMSASINQNSENAKVTDSTAAQAARQAAAGGEAVKETVQAMKAIAGKIGIVDDIAYQTNLLALNAAIEAARAGEHGKGFAVVAAEVRKLAERSQVAAQEIGELASGSVSKAEGAGKLLDEIVPAITRTSCLVQEIATASGEQSSGAAQINGAMSQINQITQQNASASEELADTAKAMSDQAEELQHLMSFFKLDNGSEISPAGRVYQGLTYAEAQQRFLDERMV